MNITNKWQHILVCLFASCVFISCGDDDLDFNGNSSSDKNVIKTVWFQSVDEPQKIELPSTLTQQGVKCTSSWASVESNGKALSIRVEDYTDAKQDDRIAFITFDGSKDKIRIVQSKYKEKDTYDVNGYGGVVVCMKDSIRLVASTLLGELPWSVYRNKWYGMKNSEDGMENTLKMKALPYYLQEFPALAVIDALNILCFGDNKVTKWYLPAIDEITLAYSRTGIIRWAWSSTEKTDLDAYYSDYSRCWGWDKSKTMAVYAFYRF